LADGAARQRFDDPRADAADADHAHVGAAEARQRAFAIQAGDAAEAALKVTSSTSKLSRCNGIHPAILTDAAEKKYSRMTFPPARAPFHEQCIQFDKPLIDTAPDFNQPIAVLKHCHDRIRKQLETLQKLLAHLPKHGADADAQKAAQAVLKYFNNAAHLHHEDEEQNLVPMLQATARDADASPAGRTGAVDPGRSPANG
jgi:hypothetical protein